jgi:hypothetical protein
VTSGSPDPEVDEIVLRRLLWELRGWHRWAEPALDDDTDHIQIVCRDCGLVEDQGWRDQG